MSTIHPSGSGGSARRWTHGSRIPAARRRGSSLDFDRKIPLAATRWFFRTSTPCSRSRCACHCRTACRIDGRLPLLNALWQVSMRRFPLRCRFLFAVELHRNGKRIETCHRALSSGRNSSFLPPTAHALQKRHTLYQLQTAGVREACVNLRTERPDLGGCIVRVYASKK